MKDDVQQILETVRTGVELYRRLIAQQREKASLIASGAGEELQALANREMGTVSQIRRCSRRLGELLPGPPLKEFVASLRDPRRSLLDRLVTRLERAVAESARINLRNFRFLQRSTGYGRAMLEQVYGLKPQYDRHGQLRAVAVGGKEQSFSY